MTPTEQRIRIMIGDLMIANAVLTSQLEEAQRKLVEKDAESNNVVNNPVK